MIYGYAQVSTDGQTAKLEGDRHVIEGDQTGGDVRASLFMDRFGFGCFRADFGRVGYGRARVGRVGVWNRPYVARSACYRGSAVGAAAVGAAAVGAATAARYYGAPCGYYPYPPCY
jgi:hypothetical protein